MAQVDQNLSVASTFYLFIYLFSHFDCEVSFVCPDCIGSAFNAKGAMQCPNCRKVEKGRWLYANGHRSSADLDFDGWMSEEIYDLSYSELVKNQSGYHSLYHGIFCYTLELHIKATINLYSSLDRRCCRYSHAPIIVWYCCMAFFMLPRIFSIDFMLTTLLKKISSFFLFFLLYFFFSSSVVPS